MEQSQRWRGVLLVVMLLACGCCGCCGCGMIRGTTSASGASPPVATAVAPTANGAAVAPSMTPFLVVAEADLLMAVTWTPTAVRSPLLSTTALPHLGSWPSTVAETCTSTATVSPSPEPLREPTPAPEPLATATPLYVLLTDKETLAHYIRATKTPLPAPSAMPEALVGKIGFRCDLFGSTTRYYVVDSDGSNIAYLTVPWCYTAMAARETIAPDGQTHIVQDNGRHGLDLFLTRWDHSHRDQLTFVGDGKAYDAAWSPLGDRIVFASNQEGDDDIFVVLFGDPANPNPRTLKLTHGDDWQSDKHPSYSPDCSQIVYYSNATGRRQLWVMAADGSQGRRLLEIEADCWDPVWFK